MSRQTLSKFDSKEINIIEFNVRKLDIKPVTHQHEDYLQLKIFGYPLEAVLLSLLDDYGYEVIKNKMMELRTVEEEAETDYGRFLLHFQNTLSKEENEEIGYSSQDNIKDATWSKEHYGKPDYTNKNVHISIKGYWLFFNDDEKYIGYCPQVNSKNAFVAEEICSIFEIPKK